MGRGKGNSHMKPLYTTVSFNDCKKQKKSKKEKGNNIRIKGKKHIHASPRYSFHLMKDNRSEGELQVYYHSVMLLRSVSYAKVI